MSMMLLFMLKKRPHLVDGQVRSIWDAGEAEGMGKGHKKELKCLVK